MAAERRAMVGLRLPLPAMTRADLMGRLLAFVARLITGAQGHWKGCPPEALQRIYFANHQSHLDWVLIWAALPSELRARTRPIEARAPTRSVSGSTMANSSPP